MKFSKHAASILKFWKSSVSRKMTLYFMVFGIIIFYATSVLYLMAFRQSVVSAITNLIQMQFAQLQNENEKDFIWHSVNTHRPDVYAILNAFINIAPDLYTINDVSILCRVKDEGRWYRLYFEDDQVIHVQPALDDFRKKLNRHHELPLILTNFHFFISRENLSLYQDISGQNDMNRYYLKVTLDRQGISGIFKTLGVHISVITAILLFVTRLLGYLFSRKLAKPIEMLSENTAKVAEGNLSAHIPVFSRDEIGALAENFNLMVEGLRERDAIKETFGRYVSREIRDEILKGNIPLDGELKYVTVLFADLRNYTNLAEKLSPREVAGIINEYFGEMAQSVNTHKGLVMQFIGDEIEAVFGAPLPLPDHSLKAVSAALDMRQRLTRVNDRLTHTKMPPLEHGIGIHTGQVLAANIGSPDRLSYTLIGDTVNLASRIQELNKEYATDILISGTTRGHLNGGFELDRIGETPIRGRDDIVELYRVV